MPHVTFIHGIANKPPAKELEEIWLRALADAVEPLSLSEAGVTSTMVYWADLLYEDSIQDVSSYESGLENTAAAVDGAGDVPPIVPKNREEAAFVAGLRAKLTPRGDAEIDAAIAAETAVPARAGTAPASANPAAPALERIPLPWALKRRFMDAFLRDVHHYLFDVSYAPPGKGQPVRIQQTIRKRFVDAVCSQDVSGPHIVVSHSMGTVIAYDCLKRVDASKAVDGLITIGSPLGLDEVQDKLQPGWSRMDGFPDRGAAKWINLYDHLDPVCGFDPKLANDYLGKGLPRVEDVEVTNNGWWRHSATKYLRQPKFCRALRQFLQV
ncbi:MAG: hypothetical protein ABW110_04560 [Steroidobacteraceae bacterium]